MITWITETIAIGEYSDALNTESLKKERINCILSLRGAGVEDSSFDEKQLCDWLGIPFHRVPVTEMARLVNVKIQLKTASYMLDLLTDKYKRILVHCTSGIDRAPFVVAYYMGKVDDEYSMTESDLKFWIGEAYKFIKRKRPQIIEHWEWI